MENASNCLAIVGATLLDGTGVVPRPSATILVEGERIVAIGDGSLEIPRGARRIDAPGKYVITGLMDANVHLFYVNTPDHLVRYEGRYEAVIAEAAQIALRSGVTTVFDTWGPRAALTVVRDQINRGERVGSRIFFAGNIIGLGGPTSADFFPIARQVLGTAEADAMDARWEQGVGADLLWCTPEEVRSRVRRYIAEGDQDFLKYAGSGHTHMQFIAFSEPVQRLIVEEAHFAGLTVQAHTTSPESLRMEIEADADLLQHPDITGAAPLPPDLLERMVKQQLPCAAMFVTQRYLDWNLKNGQQPMKSFRQIQARNDRDLVAAGARLLLTTDGGVLPPDTADHPLLSAAVLAEDSPTVLGEGHFRWLEAAAELGLSPMEALKAGTSNVAHAYHVAEDLGTVEVGKLADMLILDEDPLTDSRHYRALHTVIKGGIVIDRETLPTERVVTAALSR